MPAVPKTPEPKHIQLESEGQKLQRKGVTISIDSNKLNLITKVRTFDGDIKAFKSRIKTIQERQQEILDGMDEYTAMLKVQLNLEDARDHLKRKLERNSEWLQLSEDLADERLSLKDASDNMSDFLLAYFAETHEKQIELGPREGRELILKGKLGKAKDFQTNLFSAPQSAEERYQA